MTKFQAWKKAHSLWSRQLRPGANCLGDRRAVTTLRRKSTAERCEVGYVELVSLTPERWEPRVMGRRRTWEEALERAEWRVAREREEADHDIDPPSVGANAP